MYKFIVITDKALVPSLYDLKDISGPTTSHVYVTKHYHEWDATIGRVKTIADNCKRNEIKVLSVQILHESKLVGTDL